MENIIRYINEAIENRFVVLIKTEYSEGGYFIDPENFEYKIIKSEGKWANEGSEERNKLIKTITKLNDDHYTWVVYGDPVDTRTNIKKMMENPDTIKKWNDKSAKTALTIINNQ